MLRSRLRCAPTATSTASNPLPSQVGNREVSSGRMVQVQSDVARLENFADLRLNHVARQAVFRNSQIEHPACNRSSFENRDRITHQGEIMSRRKSNGATADDCDFIGKLFLAAAFVDIDGALRLGAILLGEKAFQCPDGDWTVDFAAAAGRLARMRAHSSADAGQWIRIARQTVGFFKASFRNQAHIAPSVGVRRAGHHAGKVRVQPIPINLFVS